MNHKLKFYLKRNKVLSRRDALQLLSDLPPNVFEAKTFEPNRKVFWGVTSGLLFLFLVFVGVLVYGWYDDNSSVVVGLVGAVFVALGILGNSVHYRNQKDQAEAQAYRNAYHVEKVLKLSKVIEDLTPPNLKSSIDLGFYSIQDYQKYYQSLRRFIQHHQKGLEAIIKAEEQALIAAEEERQKMSDINLMGKEQRGERNLKIPPKQRALLEQKRKQLLEGIYADEESALSQSESQPSIESKKSTTS